MSRGIFGTPIVPAMNAVAAKIPGTEVSINTSAPADSRSYQVDFGLYRLLAPNHQPLVDLDQSIRNLISGLQRMNFKDADFRSSELMRLKVLQGHIDSHRLNAALEWIYRDGTQANAAAGDRSRRTKESSRDFDRTKIRR